jgi:hypothetical protein
MPESARVRELLHRYLSARIPLIVVRTIEPNRALEILSSCASQLGTMAYYEYTRTEGLSDLLSGKNVMDEPSLHAALDHARTTFKARVNANFVFSDVEDLDQESTTSRHLAEMVRLAEAHQGSIILISSKPVWSGLGRLGISVELDLPTAEELAEVLGSMVEDHRGLVDIQWQYDDLRQASEILSGITEMEAINVLATMLAKGKLVPDDLPELSEFKDRIFGDLSGLERISLRGEYEIGGLANLRRWLAQKEQAMKMDLSHTSFHPPKGVLLVGVPGCGKSLSAKAIATQWNLPLYRLDMAGILGMYVGQSEQQLREALDTADRVAPCILWIDEIEKALATGAGDTGTSRRLLGQFLFWLQESTSKVFMVATANEIHSLPPELTRKGRFDEVFFVDLPNVNDREEIIRLYFRRYLGYDVPPDLTADLVSATDGFSGSEIDAVIHDLGLDSQAAGGGVPAYEQIRAHFTIVLPFSQSNPEDIAELRSWGQSRCIPAGDAIDGTAPTGGRRVVLSD